MTVSHGPNTPKNSGSDGPLPAIPTQTIPTQTIPTQTIPTQTIPTQTIKNKALALGFHKVGIASISSDSISPDEDGGSVAALEAWLAQGYHADMAWMEAPKRKDIRRIMPEVQSVICVALNYYTPHQRPDDPGVAKLSRYGWGRDYHRVMQKKLKALVAWMQASDPTIQARYYADTGPVQDKVWAQRAGLGWIAKNGNVITRDYGSWVFLGEVLTTLTLTPDVPHTAHCGSCTRCIEACPTQAIPQPFVVDANRCIAYHTIENRAATLPEAIATNLNGWVAGCDICQDVCPWNQRFAQETDLSDFQPYPGNVAPRLEDLATLTDEDYNQQFPASAFRRIKPAMMRRNAQANLAAAGCDAGCDVAAIDCRD